jgi:hypothetical protein
MATAFQNVYLNLPSSEIGFLVALAQKIEI